MKWYIYLWKIWSFFWPSKKSNRHFQVHNEYITRHGGHYMAEHRNNWIIFPSIVEKYFTSEHSERVKYFQHETRNFASWSDQYVIILNSFYYINNTIHILLPLIFDDFLKISDHFSKISEDSQKFVRGPQKCFPTFSKNLRRLPKISEDR